MRRADYHGAGMPGRSRPDKLRRCVSSPLLHEAPRGLRARLGRSLGFLLVLALPARQPRGARARAARDRPGGVGRLRWPSPRSRAALVPAAARPGSARRSLLFGASFFLYGFHSYRPQSQAFELLVTALALVLLLRLARGPGAVPRRRGGSSSRSSPSTRSRRRSRCCSCLPRVLEHRALPRGRRLLRGPCWAPSRRTRSTRSRRSTGCGCSCSSPRCCRAQPDARALYRRLFRGIAWAAIAGRGPGAARLRWASSRSRATTCPTSSTAPSTGGCSRPSATRAGSPASSPARCPSCCSSSARRAGRMRVGARRRSSRCAPPASSSRARGPPGSPGSSCSPRSRASRLAGRRLGRPLPAAGPARLAGARLVARDVRAARCRRLLADAASTGPAGAGPPGRLEGLSREMQIRGLGPHVARGAWRPSTRSSSRSRGRSWASATRASTCTCARSSRSRPRRVARVVNTAVAQRPERDRSSTTATTPTCRC